MQCPSQAIFLHNVVVGIYRGESRETCDFTGVIGVIATVGYINLRIYHKNQQYVVCT